MTDVSRSEPDGTVEDDPVAPAWKAGDRVCHVLAPDVPWLLIGVGPEDMRRRFVVKRWHILRHEFIEDTWQDFELMPYTGRP